MNYASFRMITDPLTCPPTRVSLAAILFAATDKPSSKREGTYEIFLQSVVFDWDRLCHV